MSYKLLEATSLYQKYLDYFYNKNPHVLHLPYQKHLKAVLDDCNAECDFIHTALNAMGIETSLYFLNPQKLQRSWNPDIADKTLFEIFCAQLKHEKPDILLISDIGFFTVEQIKIIREILPKHAKITGYHFTRVNDYCKKIFAYFDQLYTGSIYFCNIIKPHCKDVQLLRHAFEPSILKKLEYSYKKNQLVFSGSIIGECHNGRIDMFSSIIEKKLPFTFYGNIHNSFIRQTIKNRIKNLFIHDAVLKKRKKTERILTKYKYSGVFGIDYYQSLINNTVCLNAHATIAEKGSGNMRMFEATGTGSCLLTDHRDENSLLFDTDNEIVVYKNNAELCEKAKWLLDNPSETQKIAQAGQRRTLREYTYKHKAEQLHSYILELVN